MARRAHRPAHPKGGAAGNASGADPGGAAGDSAGAGEGGAVSSGGSPTTGARPRAELPPEVLRPAALRRAAPRIWIRSQSRRAAKGTTRRRAAARATSASPVPTSTTRSICNEGAGDDWKCYCMGSVGGRTVFARRQRRGPRRGRPAFCAGGAPILANCRRTGRQAWDGNQELRR